MPKFRERPFAVGITLALAGHLFVRVLPAGFTQSSAYEYARWLVVYAAGLAAAGFIGLRLARRERLLVPDWALLLVALVFVKCATLPEIVNFGQFLKSLAASVAFLVLAVALANAGLRERWARAALYLPAAAVAGLGLLAIYFRVRPLWASDVVGTISGSRNGSAIFLAAVLPLLLFSKRRLAWLLAAASLVVIIAGRTRSAWLMLVVYALLFAARAFFFRGRTSRAPALRFAAALTSAILCVAVLPNTLQWKSEHPYRTSLFTMASLEHSSGRDEVWRAAGQMFRASPLTGIGAGQFSVRFPRYAEVALADLGRIASPSTGVAFNDYLQEAAETGVLGGLLVFLLVALVPLRTLLVAAGGRRSIPWAFLATGIAANAVVDYPTKRPEIFFLFVVALVLSTRKYRFAWRPSVPWRGISLGTTAAAGALCLLILTQRAVSLRLRKVPTGSDPHVAYARAYAWWPWDHEWTKLLGGYVRNGPEAFAAAFERERNANWPDSPGTHLVSAYYYERTGDDAKRMAAYERAFRRWPLKANRLIASRQGTEIDWTNAQSFLEEWNGAPVVAGNWDGPYAPYTWKNDRLVPILPLSDPEAARRNFLSPTPFSATELVLAAQPVTGGGDSFEIFVYEENARRLTNLTQSPAVDSGDFCVHPASRSISWHEGGKQQSAKLRAGSATEAPAFEARAQRSGAFQHCLWKSETELLGIARAKDGVHLWGCRITGGNFSCKESPLSRELDRVVGFFTVEEKRHGVIALKKNETFRKAYLFAEEGRSLVPLPTKGTPGDVLDFEGTHARVGLHGRYTVVGPDASLPNDESTTVYRSRTIGDAVYGIVATPNRPRHLAKVVGGKWLGLGAPTVESSAEAPPQEVWIQGTDPKDIVQAFYFGLLDPDRVVVWWHGGPRENVSPRYNPYFRFLNAAGFGVLAVNFPGSTGRGSAYERTFSERTLAQTAGAVLRYLKENDVRTVASWSVSAGSLVNDVIIKNQLPYAGLVDQASSPPSPGRRERASAANLAYFNIHGTFDSGGRSGATFDFRYPGGHDITRREDLEAMTAGVRTFLHRLPKTPAFPRTNASLALDPGHDGNASDPNEVLGLREATLTFELARSLQATCGTTKLAATRTASASLQNRSRSLQLRKRWRDRAAIPFLSLHFNASDPALPSANLASVFVAEKSTDAEVDLAGALVTTTARALGIGLKDAYPELQERATRLRPGVFARDIAVLGGKRPSCTWLLEASYYDDKEENARLRERTLDPMGAWEYPRLAKLSRDLCGPLKALSKCTLP